MKFIKKNKFTIIAIIFFMALVVLGVQVKNLLVPDEGKASYGDRLENIESHKLPSDLLTNITSKLKENTNILEVSNNVHGKIINFMITVNSNMTVSEAKVIASSVIPMFENNELGYYSLQVYLLKEDKTLNNFPIIGYKGTETNELIFTKDREITTEGEADINEE